MKKVLINKPIHNDAIDLLKNEVELILPFKATQEDIEGMISDVQGIILCAGFKMPEEVIEKCKSIEVIGRHGAGLDIVDVKAATSQNIPVVFTPEGPTESTAEHAFMLMMATARKLSFLDRSIRDGNFHVRDTVVGMELRNKKVGVIGFGHIGQRFAQMCKKAFEMEVFVYDPVINPEKVKAWGATQIEDKVELARQVDIISVHCPLMPQTKHIVNQSVIENLGSNGILINTSRGPTVDEQALIEALSKNLIYGAGLDVFDPEPPDTGNPLFNLDNVVLTPHLASFTDEGRRRMGVTVAEDVLKVLNGKKPTFIANPSVYE